MMKRDALADLRLEREKNLRTQESWRRSFAVSKSEKYRDICQQRLAASMRTGERIEAKIAELGQEKGMRHVEEPVVEVVAPWPWRVVKGSCSLGKQGAIVSDEALAASRNGAFYIRAGYVARVPPPIAKVARPSPNIATSQQSSPAPSALARAKARVHAIADERRISRRAAIDVVAHPQVA
jgi:hypothetical protein